VNDAFHAITSSIDYPMVVVTARHDREPSGCLVGFHTQCSIDPPRWLVCLSRLNHTYRIAQQASVLVVHFLRADQGALADLFGAETGDQVDKFAQCSWHAGPGGAPVLEGCDWIAGTVLARVDLGDHEGQLLDVTDAFRAPGAQPPLGFQAARDVRPGHPA
jgi:flavin reductase (DIM6/NTAB) family NADH-FMN oxidoreductase RutF